MRTRWTQTLAAGSALAAALGAPAALAQAAAAPTAPTAPAAPRAAPATPAAAAAPAAPAGETVQVIRRKGTFTPGTVETMRYTPNCGAFVIGMDAEAIQNATSRQFLLEQQNLYDALQPRWEAHQDCITVNAQADYDLFEPLLSRTIRARIDADIANFNTVAAAPGANLERIQAAARARPAQAPRNNRRGNQQQAAPEPPPPPPGVPAVTWTAPTGRLPGVFSGGPADQVTYTSSCPDYRLEVTVNDFNTVADPAAFNAMVEILRSAPTRLTAYHQCLADQANEDLRALDEVINAGADAVLRPAADQYGRQRAEISRQLNLHREPGGLLAAGDPARRPAPAAPARPRRPR